MLTGRLWLSLVKTILPIGCKSGADRNEEIAMSGYQRILVPVDGSPTSNAGMDEAIRLAKLTDARIRIVHVLDGNLFGIGCETYVGDVLGMLSEAGAQILTEAKARVESSRVPVETFITEMFGERVCDVVADQANAWNADLIVIGTHGRRGARRLLLGSDAEQIVRSAPVPVLLVRMPEPKDVHQPASREDAQATAQSALAA
jgi:nucleotide-binding universal stress UspA family protein